MFAEKTFRLRNESSLAAVKIGPTGERVESDVFHTLSPVYYLSKVCGLLPVRFEKNKAGKYSGKLVVHQVMYGYAIFVFYCLFGVVHMDGEVVLVCVVADSSRVY